MSTFNIHEAKTHFSQLVNQALAGEEVVIARGNHPLITLVPYKKELPPRKGGQLRGLIQMSEDFDDPLSQELLDAFYKTEE